MYSDTFSPVRKLFWPGLVPFPEGEASKLERGLSKSSWFLATQHKPASKNWKMKILFVIR